MYKVAVIGSGFSGLASACFLAKNGYDVSVFEKNEDVGGRARSFHSRGFTFDMGPSWYWMPDVFERFFNQFGKTTSDYYTLKRLDPSYRVIFSEKEHLDIPANRKKLGELFEKIESGSEKKLKDFLTEAAFKYEEGVKKLVYMPSLSPIEFIRGDVLKGFFRIQLLSSIAKDIRSRFKDPKIQSILEFPSLFLGATPENTPALYSLMNYADIELGTWYPEGGMVKIVDGMKRLAEDLGVKIFTNSNVEKISVKNKTLDGLYINNTFTPFNLVVSSADYHFTETHLLEKEHQSYSEKYWNSRTLAPSAIIYYLGISKKVKNLLHHNLFFDEDFKKHASELYDNPKWPSKPLFYVCAPSKTDETVAPKGKENLFLLIPVATGLINDTEELRRKYLKIAINRIEKSTKTTIWSHIEYEKSYSVSNFIEDYNSYKGNAYGLANTLKQTAFLKPKIKSQKVKNLYYAGQLTVPGPGVPPSLISGEVTAQYITKNHPNHETVI